MSKVFDKPIEVRQKPDGSFTVSVRINDQSIVVVTVERPEIERLSLKLIEELKDG